MKKIIQFSAVFLLVFLAACGPSTEDAINFNDTLVNDQKEILALEDNLINSIVDWHYEQAQTDLKIYQEKLTEYIKKYEEMKSFDKEDEFRLSMIYLLKELKQQADMNYPKVLDFIPQYVSLDSVPDEPLAKFFDILDEIDLKSDAANNQFLDAQKKFADKYKLKLQ